MILCEQDRNNRARRNGYGNVEGVRAFLEDWDWTRRVYGL